MSESDLWVPWNTIRYGSQPSDLAVVCPGAAHFLQVPRAEAAAQREGPAASAGWTLPAGHLTGTGNQRTAHRRGGWAAGGLGPHQVAGAVAAWLHAAEQAAAALSPADNSRAVDSEAHAEPGSSPQAVLLLP